MVRTPCSDERVTAALSHSLAGVVPSPDHKKINALERAAGTRLGVYQQHRGRRCCNGSPGADAEIAPTRPQAAGRHTVSAAASFAPCSADLRDRDALEEMAAGERTEDMESFDRGTGRIDRRVIGADVETAAERVDAHDAVGKHLRQQGLHRVGSQAADTRAVDDPVEAVDFDPPPVPRILSRAARRPSTGRNAVETRRANRQPARSAERVDACAHRRREAAPVREPCRFRVADETTPLIQAQAFPKLLRQRPEPVDHRPPVAAVTRLVPPRRDNGPEQVAERSPVDLHGARLGLMEALRCR